MIPQDYHLHSHHSVDSEATIAEMCLGAVEAGIPEIGLTEHFDLHPRDPAWNWFKPGAWMTELDACRTRFAGELVVRAGVEAGEPHRYAAELRALVESHPLDYVIGSLHWVGEDFIFYPQYFERPASEAFGKYFLELRRMAETGDFDILGHLDVPARLSAAHYGPYDPAAYEDLIRPVLHACIERGIALDINTSPVRRGLDLLTPGRDILAWYREMGGERVTLGSDAHRPGEVGAHLEQALAAMRHAGLSSLTFFERRRPRLEPLPHA